MSACRVMFWSTIGRVFNARTAEEPHFLRMAELQPFLPTALDEDELPDYIQQRRNQDALDPSFQTWVPELLGFYLQADCLTLNGRTLGDRYEQFSFRMLKAAAAPLTILLHLQCFPTITPLHVFNDAACRRSDHNALLLPIADKFALKRLVIYMCPHSHLICQNEIWCSQG